MIVMQLRGSDVDHQFGLKLSIETPGSSGVKEMVSLTVWKLHYIDQLLLRLNVF